MRHLSKVLYLGQRSTTFHLNRLEKKVTLLSAVFITVDKDEADKKQGLKKNFASASFDMIYLKVRLCKFKTKCLVVQKIDINDDSFCSSFADKMLLRGLHHRI